MQDVQDNRAGRRQPKRKLIGWGVLAGVALVILAIFLVSRGGSPTVPATATPATTETVAASVDPSQPPVVDLASMNQAERRAFVLKLIGQGVFTGVQASQSPPKVGVTPLFQSLNASLKQQFIAAVDAYVHDGAATSDALQVIDATSGKLIGTYTVAEGLKLL